VARWLGYASAGIILGWFVLAQPILAQQSELAEFGEEVRRVAGERRPWPEWHVVLLDARPKSAYYLRSEHPAARLPVETIRKRLAQVRHDCPATIFVARHRSGLAMRDLFSGYRVVIERPDLVARSLGREDEDACVAFVPDDLPDEASLRR
jgi:hypothetical protein